MDPDITLEEIRKHVKTWEDDSINEATAEELLEKYCDLAEKINTLDKWLTNGGYLPDDWE